jgi:uncharacterized protein YdeI (YjbR/CyaY-like superfamily)
MAVIPADFKQALATHPKAKARWDDLTPIAQRDFTSWIISARQAETRTRRIGKACDMLVKGKRRPCCYAVVPMDLYSIVRTDAKVKTPWKKLSADEKRDFNDWVSMARNSQESRVRAKKAAAMIAAGKKQP